MEHNLGGDSAVIIASALVAILSSSSSVSKDKLVQGSAFAEITCSSVYQKPLQLLNGEMSWNDNSSLLGLWPYKWIKHTVSQNGEFIARYCLTNDNYICFCSTACILILPSLIDVSKFMTDEVIEFNENSTSD